ncbi:uncharacterized protein N7469_006565 [Penicillium citrinum]|uniref:Uncharacterized protein n=2 Tax=Penicillium TaxID=5073 RepID=A0A9W9NUV7_PENCI|nr:uncharacterized protein N7469_006565 [Penicillium citrinum]KAJ5226559.1 hypothetical protein N7469_006565 [Penicillium citrinum]KAJ5569373.1 hypothetical protein N7450_011859 [Penicillium hetheringtonii]
MTSVRSSSDRTGSIQSEDRPKTSFQSKADPNLALYEEQPMAVNTQPGSRDQFSLRSVQHRDRDGNIIVDPDRSNPTRSRLERPLDTIRSFEAAIDNHRRQDRM